MLTYTQLNKVKTRSANFKPETFLKPPLAGNNRHEKEFAKMGLGNLREETQLFPNPAKSKLTLKLAAIQLDGITFGNLVTASKFKIK